MTDIASWKVVGGIGVLTIDSPPVNALGIAVRLGIAQGVEALNADERVKAIVLTCAGRTFFAGADISEFGKPLQHPDLWEVLDVIEGATKPVVAAIHGTALGGGLELALVCHYRIAVPSARVGLPEVHLGLLPGAGGTQRLPRIVGAKAALDLIVTGRPIKAPEAADLGILDRVAEEGRLVEDAVAFAEEIVREQRSLLRVRDREDKLIADRGRPELFGEFRKRNARLFKGFKAPENIVRAVEAAVDLPFDQGIKRERALFRDLEASGESAAQRYAFFAERETSKVPDVPSNTLTRMIGRVGVIGAGTMGGGIAMNFLNAGIPVVLVEANQEALDRGLAVIRGHYENSAKKGKLSQAQVEQRMALLAPSLNFEPLGDVDLIIEAVFEEMGIKKEVFARLDAVAKLEAILASNTSFLDLDEIAAATNRPESVVGLHFFSPANVMRLLEVVRGAKTSKEVIATAMQLAKKIGKVPVLSGVCPGFIANRVMLPRSEQGDAVILEGPTPHQVDKVMVDYGFTMGPFQMIDLVGLDVIGRGNSERTVIGDLVGLGRLGQKKNGGYYDYDDRRAASPSPVAAQVIANFAAFRGITQGGPQSEDDIRARLLFPIVNEGAKLLEEGIALRASDIDMAAILGYNWPVYTGGPMFWADTIGLPRIVAGLKDLEKRFGDRFRPAPLLEKLAAEGGAFTR
jgi:3-hydroxyacyl-CoA dehydrogenase